MSEHTMWEIEDSLGLRLICGVDEAGRGPLAGPVCAAAVILPEHLQIPGLNDSKKLTIDTIIIMYLNVSTIICSRFELENISVWFSLHVIKHSC